MQQAVNRFPAEIRAVCDLQRIPADTVARVWEHVPRTTFADGRSYTYMLEAVTRSDLPGKEHLYHVLEHHLFTGEEGFLSPEFPPNITNAIAVVLDRGILASRLPAEEVDLARLQVRYVYTEDEEPLPISKSVAMLRMRAQLFAQVVGQIADTASKQVPQPGPDRSKVFDEQLRIAIY